MPEIIISNLEEFELKKQQILEEGIDTLHVVADFDRTLTKAFVEGELASTSFAKVRKGKVLPKEYEEEADKLFKHYKPIEDSKQISEKEKNIQMREWWRLHLELMIKYGISKEIFRLIAQSKSLQLRELALKLFTLLKTHNVPFIIMSAGLGDLIIEVLRRENLLFDNVHVISNLFKWDENGRAIGLANPVIHSSNKHEVELQGRPFYEEVQRRHNVILLGDSEGDLGMTAGISLKTLLKIAFLNNEGESETEFARRLELFKQKFDVVLLGDTDMKFVNDLLKSLVK